ncbi:TIGR03862 family flavoprotein [Ramlibacter ginsenosidimutans]|uniref:TIGR03862 family flavoprotein n=1 Tax=Ramlibacter ginsenosidimutans TaxID=502333 RepID=A0A934TUE6_9BURK|nr:TIGR03862 family flavoprotein [Ramlibacter ginsenosidimutans]MBK6007598.1 TIGR03862 family flavoprotein [Ramlibacter ginsenosidimutans]
MTARQAQPPARAAVIGGGPAGLMAAEVLAAGGVAVDLFDAMPSVGRKFLLAGRGGLNLTHSESTERLLGRYGERRGALAAAIAAFDGSAVRAWADALGIGTFVGTSGRVFPKDMKAAPLLRAWLHRLRESGVKLHARHRWTGWDAHGALRLHTPGGEVLHAADATVLALGGASWSRLGSDGAWVPWLEQRGVAIAPLQPSNCGFDVQPTGPGRSGWSEHLRQRFAGQPLKTVAAFTDAQGRTDLQAGEFVVTDTGVEGSLVYAFSARLRDAIASDGGATLYVDLLPQHSEAQVLAECSHPRGPRSLSTHLKSRLGLHGLKMALLHELLTPGQLADAAQLARAIKALPLPLARPRPLDEAISTAGGVRFDALDEHLMLRALPGVFCAGEMLDWEAPTGGYLLTACMATGRVAAQGALHWLRALRPPPEG